MDRFNGSLQNERRVPKASLKVSQLERKWQQILQEERRSCLRNRKLLEDFDRIKQQSKVFSKKSDRLKQAKHNFELYVKSVYPRWTEELKQLQELKEKRTSKDSKPPSLQKHSEISGYVVGSDNVLLNPAFSSTPYRNGISFSEPERLTHSVGLEEVNQMPKNSGYNHQYPSNSNQQYLSNGGYPIGHPMSNLSNNRSWVYPKALPSGMFPYMGNFSPPTDRPHQAMPWQNTNHSYGGHARYGFNPNGVSYLDMGNVPRGSSQSFQDYEGDPIFSGNYHGNSAEARTFQQRDHDGYMHGVNQVPRHGQKYDDADPTPHDSKLTYSKKESCEENDEQPKTRNVSAENCADPGNHKTIQERRVGCDRDTNCSTDIGDNFRDEIARENRKDVGKNGKTRDPESKVIKETNTDISDISTDFDNVRKNEENDSSIIQVNPATNQEPTDSSQCRKKENDENRVNSDSSLPTSQGHHHEHSVKESKSPESDVESSPPNTPKDLGPQNKHHDSSHEPADSSQVHQIKSANAEISAESEVPRKKEQPKTNIMDDLVGADDDVISDFEISGSEISEDVPCEHEIVTGNNKESIHISENITEKYGTVPEMKDLNVQDNEPINELNDNSILNDHSDSKEPTDIDAETVANTGTEMHSQDKGEHFSEPKEERDEPQERDFQIGSKEESKDTQAREELSQDSDLLSERQDEEQTGVLEDISFSSEDSSSESISLKKKSDREKSEEKNETKESMSYSEDFEDEKSILLTETDAYLKMLSSVKVSDEEDDIEDLLAGSIMYEAKTVGQKKQDDNTQQPSKQCPVSESSSTSKKQAKPSKSKPKLSVFSSGEADGLENSFRNDSEGILTSSWKSSEMTLSPPLSPDMDMGGYDPTVVGDKKVDGKDKKETDKGRKGADEKVFSKNEKEQGIVKQETGKEKQESKTKSRIQAGFWNHSDTESEIDLQVSHDVDNDDDFDFYS